MRTNDKLSVPTRSEVWTLNIRHLAGKSWSVQMGLRRKSVRMSPGLRLECVQLMPSRLE